MKLENEVKEAARNAGADLVGIAELDLFKDELCGLPTSVTERFTSALSIAFRLDDEIVDGIEDEPTPAYARHYEAVNTALDAMTAWLVNWMDERGYAGLAIPASQVVDEANLRGCISHKAVARMAGIGWQGKSLLIVSPQFGPRNRLSTVLTNMPLKADKPLKSRCGRCMECAEACPAHAIKGLDAKERYQNRDEALYFSRCVGQTIRFKARPEIGTRICGVCVRACPFGRRKRGRAESSSPTAE